MRRFDSLNVKCIFRSYIRALFHRLVSLFLTIQFSNPFRCLKIKIDLIRSIKMAPNRGKCVFNPELKKKYPFLEAAKNKTPSDVYCLTCNSDFSIANAGKSDIEKHITTMKHKKALQSASTSRTVTQFFPSTTDTNLAACEGVWAYHVIKANHSFLSSECASRLFRTCFEIRKFHCARTKCEMIATNVFAPFARSSLKAELAERHYITVSTDASNRGNVKMMPVVVRYFVPTEGVRVKLLEFGNEKGETSEIITTMIMKSARKNEISDKIVGFCADNCATNFGNAERGGRNNVFYRLKQWREEIIGVGCAAHIVHNALKHACDRMPSLDVECIVVKIYSYFYIHTIRVEALKEICDLSEIEYKQLLGYAKTRYLALGPAIGSILKLWEPLKKFFLQDKNCPDIIDKFFKSDFSKLWLLFVKEQARIREMK